MSMGDYPAKEFDPERDRAPLKPGTREGRMLRGTDDAVTAWMLYCTATGTDPADYDAYRRWMEERGTPVGWR